MKYVVKNTSGIIYIYGYYERTEKNEDLVMEAQLKDGDILEGTYDGNEYVRVVRVNGRKLRAVIAVNKEDVMSCSIVIDSNPPQKGDYFYKKFLRDFENRPSSIPTATDISDVGKIIEMQHKIDVYENFITLLFCMIQGCTPEALLLQSDLELEDTMNKLWRFVRDKINEGKG